MFYELQENNLKNLFVMTLHYNICDLRKKKGFWMVELYAPYYTFVDAGAEVVLASPAGGQPPLDPKSNEPDAQTETTKRFEADEVAMQALANTHKLSEVLNQDFDAVFYPGGHGPLWDLAKD